MLAAAIVGVLAVLMLAIDFKVSKTEQGYTEESADVAAVLRKMLHGAILALCLVVAGQLLMRLMQSQDLGHAAPWFCFVCK
jgi:hypothetical protein